MVNANASTGASRFPGLWRWAIFVVAIVVVWIFFPPFRIVPLDDEGNAIVGDSDPSEVFDAEVFVEQFWSETLMPALNAASDLEAILVALSRDPAEALKRHGRKVGVGTTVYYFAAGEGEVVELEGRRAILDMDGVRVAVQIGAPVFGNAVRDGCGLLSVNDVPGLEEFNALSAALNEKVESSVLADAREIAVVGASISFVGCSKAPESIGEGPALDFIPLHLEVAQ